MRLSRTGTVSNELGDRVASWCDAGMREKGGRNVREELEVQLVQGFHLETAGMPILRLTSCLGVPRVRSRGGTLRDEGEAI